ncbi:unnamed protein product [Mytilus coruscus]|uniref:Ig-like domain-containing protein n=1 Tax=Mytilus coruscus TaxID=42192 RepID=A0A6J8E2N2_MYTCO|nr:unnamed protein product [Mytilus coruscus]
MYISDDIVSCQSVSIVTSREVNYQEDKLKLGCSPSQVSMWSYLVRITLSKNTSIGFQDIVTVHLNISTLRNETVWTQQVWQHRATIIKEYINPHTTDTGLEFDIQAEDVLCSDDGTFRCNAIGGSMNAPIERETMGTVELLVKPTTVNQIEVSPKQEMEKLYKPNTLIELSCTGTVGRNPAGELRWCYRRDDMFNFIGWPNADDYDPGMLVSIGCQNIRTSTLRYNVSADYQYTEFRCETGDSEPIQSTTLSYDETTSMLFKIISICEENSIIFSQNYHNIITVSVFCYNTQIVMQLKPV